MSKLLIYLWLTAVFMMLSQAVFATAWYVNGVTGNNNNNCLSSTTACKTIGEAISLANSGDSIKVAAATYAENLTIGKDLKFAVPTIANGRVYVAAKGHLVVFGLLP